MSVFEITTTICLFQFFPGLQSSYTGDTAQTLAVARTLKSCKQIGMRTKLTLRIKLNYFSASQALNTVKKD